MRIIIIEKNKKIRIFLRKIFKAACYVVDTADNEKKGLFLTKNNFYNLVCLSCRSEIDNCADMCGKIKKDCSKASMIVFLSKSDSKTRIRFYNIGVDECLVRTISVEELLARVKIILKRKTNIENTILRIDDLILDVSRHYITRGKKRITLTLKEIKLLRYLLDNQGIVMSRGQILENVWDSNADPFSNTIEAHVFSLRKKIDSDGKKKLIHTINGRGYKIDV